MNWALNVILWSVKIHSTIISVDLLKWNFPSRWFGSIFWKVNTANTSIPSKVYGRFLAKRKMGHYAHAACGAVFNYRAHTGHIKILVKRILYVVQCFNWKWTWKMWIELDNVVGTENRKKERKKEKTENAARRTYAASRNQKNEKHLSDTPSNEGRRPRDKTRRKHDPDNRLKYCRMQLSTKRQQHKTIWWAWACVSLPTMQ